jgi:hypothetical protein
MCITTVYQGMHKTDEFEHKDMIPAKYRNTDMIPAKYRNKDMIPAKYRNTDMIPAKYRNKDMIPAKYRNTDMIPAKYQNTDMIPAKYRNKDMIPAKYRNKVRREEPKHGRVGAAQQHQLVPTGMATGATRLHQHTKTFVHCVWVSNTNPRTLGEADSDEAACYADGNKSPLSLLPLFTACIAEERL